MNNAPKNCYVYLIGWSKIDKWYFGSKYGANANPLTFWKDYFTSSKQVKEVRKKYGEPDIIQIRKTFGADSERCRKYEYTVLRRAKVKSNPRWLNISDTPTICSEGMISCFDKEGNVTWISKEDPRYKTGEFLHVLSKRVHGYDIHGKYIGTFYTNDPIWRSGNVFSSNKNKILVRDLNTQECFLVSKNDPRWLSGELRGVRYQQECNTRDWTKNTAVAVDAQTKELLGRIKTDDPRWKTGEIIGHRNGKQNKKNSELKKGKAPAKDPVTGEYLGMFFKDDIRWKTKEIVGIKKAINHGNND